MSREQIDVLVVDDQEALAASTTEYLTLSGVPARHVSSAEAALDAIAEFSPRMLLLDVNLPGASGFELCRTVRRERDLPIVFLSARTGEDDQILGLAVGGR